MFLINNTRLVQHYVLPDGVRKKKKRRIANRAVTPHVLHGCHPLVGFPP